MHELSITENILEIVLRHAQQANARRVLRLFLVIGQLSSIVDESVNFYWNIIAKDTLAESAVLEFRRIPAEFQCQECYTQFTLRPDDFSCPKCGSVNVKILNGNELYIEAIDVE